MEVQDRALSGEGPMLCYEMEGKKQKGKRHMKKRQDTRNSLAL
jgi:hypothetical protein